MPQSPAQGPMKTRTSALCRRCHAKERPADGAESLPTSTAATHPCFRCQVQETRRPGPAAGVEIERRKHPVGSRPLGLMKPALWAHCGRKCGRHLPRPGPEGGAALLQTLQAEQHEPGPGKFRPAANLGPAARPAEPASDCRGSRAGRPHNGRDPSPTLPQTSTAAHGRAPRFFPAPASSPKPPSPSKVGRESWASGAA